MEDLIGSSSDRALDLIDLAAPLLPTLEANLHLPIGDQISAWTAYHSTFAPTLLNLIVTDYQGVEGGWRAIAESRIFPALAGLLPRMKLALVNLRSGCAEWCQEAQEKLGLREHPLVVAYVGLGNGAGWATVFDSHPAVLIGLENVAELGWEQPRILRGLLAHEMGHLLMQESRHGAQTPAEDPFLTLFEEGFAMECEHLVLGCEHWHCSSDESWLEWCRTHEGELCNLFMAAVKEYKQWRRFFGSWFEVQGRRQTGYYLGWRFVQRALNGSTLRELATWPRELIREEVRNFLVAMTRR